MKNISFSPHPNGFTLIEILVVFSIIAIVSTASLASFSDFNRVSATKQAGAQLAAFLTDAKSRALSQVKPSSCTGSFDGYVVDICITTGSGCTYADSYKMSVLCSGSKSTITTKRLPSSMHFDSNATSSTSYRFNVLTGGVTGPGSTVITGNDSSITVNVTAAGAVTYQ